MTGRRGFLAALGALVAAPFMPVESSWPIVTGTVTLLPFRPTSVSDELLADSQIDVEEALANSFTCHRTNEVSHGADVVRSAAKLRAIRTLS